MNYEWRIITLLADADDAVLKAFDERGWPVSYAEGESVVWEGDECQAVYFIIAGMVEVYRTAIDGRAHTLRVLRVGDSFNLVPVRLAGMTGLVGELALHTVRQRTAAFLMREAENVSIEKGWHWTQDDMARQIGTVRDVIGRTLRDFEEKGFIRRDRGNISLIDREGLERTANGHK